MNFTQKSLKMTKKPEKNAKKSEKKLDITPKMSYNTCINYEI